MTSEKDPLAELKVVEPGAGADAQASVFVGEAEFVGPGETFPNELPSGGGGAVYITQQQFYDTMFSGLFAAPAMINPVFAPIAIQDSEKGAARPASDALYELLMIYYPSILQPGGRTAGLLMMMLPFLILKATTIRAIFTELKTPRNDTNGAGEGQGEQ